MSLSQECRGTFCPTYDENDTITIDCDRVIFAVGQASVWGDLVKNEQVKIETARCLGCGATVVDPNKCIGCGVCTTKCAFDAITLHRDHPECSEMTVAEDKFKKILPYQAKRAIRIALHKKK